LSTCSVVEKEKSNWTDADLNDISTCNGYVRGLATGVEAEQSYAEAATGKKVIPAPFCLPDEIPNGQIVRIVLKSIRDNPDKSHEGTAILIMGALGHAFPCSDQ
jgi:hypothetical protein